MILKDASNRLVTPPHRGMGGAGRARSDRELVEGTRAAARLIEPEMSKIFSGVAIVLDELLAVPLPTRWHFDSTGMSIGK